MMMIIPKSIMKTTGGTKLTRYKNARPWKINTGLIRDNKRAY
jgi:hypothetical protein